jgi:fatty-acyl-CoA synthase
MTGSRPIDDAPTVGAALMRAAAWWPDQDALVCDGVRLTYRELADATRRTAAALLSRGVARGEAVAICMSTSATAVTLFYATALIGAVAAPIDPRGTADALAQRLLQSASVLLATIDQLRAPGDVIDGLRTIEPALDRGLPGAALPRLRTVAVLGRAVPQGAVGYGIFTGQVAAPRLIDRPAVERAAAAVTADDGVVVPPGAARAAAPSHADLLRDAASAAARLGLQRGDRCFSAWSFQQAAGVTAILAAALHGACLVTMPDVEPSEALRLIERERCTQLAGDAVALGALTGHADFDPAKLSLRDGLSAPPAPTPSRPAP